MPSLFAALVVLLAAAGPSAPQGDVSLPIDLSRYPVRGSAGASVLVVEFSDFKCHACEKFSLTVMPNLTREFIEPGKVKVVFVDFPLVGEASYTNVAESPHCAGLQGKYWPMHDTLWQKIGALGDQHLATYAAGLGLDAVAFRKCLEGDQFVPRILADLKFSYDQGLSSRPTFFIGRRRSDGTWRGRYVVGAQSYLVFKTMIGRMLASEDPAAAPSPAAPSAPAPSPAPKGLPGYQGSGSCGGCHAGQLDEWRGSLHARTVHEPTEQERGLLGRSLLCADGDPKWVLGEKRARRFMVASGIEPGRHALLPCRYDVGSASWTHLHENDWQSLTWERGCGACHTTGFSSDDLGFREMGVGCESCHGPGSRHGGMEDRGGMVSFKALGAADEVTVCASCHLQGGRSRRTGLSFAYNYEAGGDLLSDYQFDFSELDRPPAAARGPIDIHQKILIRRVLTQGDATMRCTSCHDFHEAGHARHTGLPRQEYCHLCHEASGFALKEYDQSCNVCEF